MRTHTAHARDAALRELHRINRWLIAGSVVLTGVLTDAAAHAFPGKTVKQDPTNKTTGAQGHTNGSAGDAQAQTSRTTTESLQPPAQAPLPATESPTPQQPAAPQESAPAQATPGQESSPAVESAPAPAPTPEPPPVSSGAS
jgi:hypothetical protein